MVEQAEKVAGWWARHRRGYGVVGQAEVVGCRVARWWDRQNRYCRMAGEVVS